MNLNQKSAKHILEKAMGSQAAGRFIQGIPGTKDLENYFCHALRDVNAEHGKIMFALHKSES